MTDIDEEMADEFLRQQTDALEEMKGLEEKHNAAVQDYRAAYEYLSQKQSVMEITQHNLQVARSNLQTKTLVSLCRMLGLDAPMRQIKDVAKNLEEPKQ